MSYLHHYSMSKHTVGAFTDASALKLASLGVQVSVIEPGNDASEIGRNATQRTGRTSRMTDRSHYKPPTKSPRRYFSPCTIQCRSVAI